MNRNKERSIKGGCELSSGALLGLGTTAQQKEAQENFS